MTIFNRSWFKKKDPPKNGKKPAAAATTIKHPPAAKYTPPPVSPRRQKFNAMPVVEGCSLEVDIETFVMLSRTMQANWPDETAGYAIVSDDMRIVWFKTCSRGTSAHVSCDTTPAVVAALEEGIDPSRINCQYHTHPTMTAYWSGTDLDSQFEHCEEVMAGRPTGGMMFIVYSSMDWLVRIILWQDGEYIGRSDAYAKLVTPGGQSLPITRKDPAHDPNKPPPVILSSKSYGTASYGTPAWAGIPGQTNRTRTHPAWDYGDDYWGHPVPKKTGLAKQSSFLTDDDEFSDTGIWEHPDKYYDRLYAAFGVEKYERELLFLTLQLKFGEDMAQYVLDNRGEWDACIRLWGTGDL